MFARRTGVVHTNRTALVAKIAREDEDRLLAEETERQASTAIEACAVCDRDGHRWFKHNDTPTIREDPEAAYNIWCDHADPDDLEWATANVLAEFPDAGNVVPIEGTR